ELYVKHAEIGKELGVGVELMAVPRAVPPHSYFGKPLPSENEVAIVAGARHHLGKLVVKLNVKLDRLARCDGLRQLHLDDSFVVGIAVVRRDEFQLRSQIALSGNFKFLDVDRAVIFRIPFVQPRPASLPSLAMRLANPCRLGLEGIEIEVEGKAREWLAGEVLVGQHFGGIERL